MHLSARTSAGLAAYIVLASTMAAGTAFAAGGGQSPSPSHTAATAAAATTAHAPVAAKKAVAKKAVAKKAAAKAAPVKAVSYPDDLDGWIAEARHDLVLHGDKVPSAGAIKARAMTESSGNPLAENHWDGNQALYGGTYGLLQTIKPTFAQWSLPGHKDIADPVDSIIAGVRYANDRYGSFTEVAYTKQGY